MNIAKDDMEELGLRVEDEKNWQTGKRQFAVATLEGNKLKDANEYIKTSRLEISMFSLDKQSNRC